MDFLSILPAGSSPPAQPPGQASRAETDEGAPFEAALEKARKSKEAEAQAAAMAGQPATAAGQSAPATPQEASETNTAGAPAATGIEARATAAAALGGLLGEDGLAGGALQAALEAELADEAKLAEQQAPAAASEPAAGETPASGAPAPDRVGTQPPSSSGETPGSGSNLKPFAPVDKTGSEQPPAAAPGEPSPAGIVAPGQAGDAILPVASQGAASQTRATAENGLPYGDAGELGAVDAAAGPDESGNPAGPEALAYKTIANQHTPAEPARMAEARGSEMAAHIRQSAELLDRSGQATVRVQIHSEGMGQIELRLARGEAGLQIAITPETAGAGQLLQRHLGELRSALEAAGVAFSSLSVGVGGEHSQGGGEEAAPRRHSRHAGAAPAEVLASKTAAAPDRRGAAGIDYAI